MTLEQVKEAMSTLIQQHNIELSLKNKGVIIKTSMEALKGKTDGKVINEALSSLMSEQA